jgi:hypothetical protein
VDATVDAVPGDVELLVTESSVRIGGSPWLMVAGLGVVVAVAAALVMNNDTEVAVEPEPAVEQVDEQVDEQADDAVDEDADEPQPAVEDADEPELEQQPQYLTSAAGEPLVGETTGLGVLVSSYDGLPVRLVALDTGQVHELADVRGSPIGMIDQHLVLQDQNVVRIADLGSPQPQAVQLDVLDPGAYTEVLRLDGEAIWVASYQPVTEPELLAYSVDGELLSVRTIETESAVTYADFLIPGIGAVGFDPALGVSLVQGVDGGVYRSEEGGFERLGFGRLLLVDGDRALVTECDEGLLCRSVWRDRLSWSPIDLPSLDIQDGVLALAGDRWLVNTAWSGEARLLDLTTGRVRHRWLVDNEWLSAGLNQIVSDDGRWLVTRVEDAVTVLDLFSQPGDPESSGTEWVIPIPVNGRDVTVALVDLNGTAFETRS